MEQTHVLRSVLSEVPRTLLTPESAKVLDGVVSSLGIIDRLASQAPVVVLVGPTGAGTSYVFNAIVGVDASPEGVLRPTTSSVVVAGDLTLSEYPEVSDAVILPRSDAGFTLIDVPGQDVLAPWFVDVTHGADLAVMVVSPIRYADAAVAALWESLDRSTATVVLNRVTTTGEETSELVTLVTDTFGTEPYVIREGGDGSAAVADHIVGLIPESRTSAVESIMYRTAVAGARLIVRDVTNAALAIGKVADAVDDMPGCVTDTTVFDVQVSWDGTREGILERVAIGIRDKDDDVVRASGTELAPRVLESIGPWDDDDLSETLDTWRDTCISVFSEASSVRWRRRNAEQLIEQFSWSAAIHQGIVAPTRFSKLLRGGMDETASRMRCALEELICETFDARLALWHEELDRLGGYQPGTLASAADVVESRQPRRG